MDPPVLVQTQEPYVDVDRPSLVPHPERVAPRLLDRGELVGRDEPDAVARAPREHVEVRVEPRWVLVAYRVRDDHAPGPPEPAAAPAASGGLAAEDASELAAELAHLER